MGETNFLRLLARQYPSERIFTEDQQLSPYESDALTAFAVRPRAVVVPESTEEVIETIRLCSREKVPFVARGSGTSLSGGCLPVEGGIVIALNRLDRILEINSRRRIARVEPGVVNLRVSEAAAPYNLYFAPDPSSQQICTIGGNLAFNSGGAHCLKYGMTTNHVLGVKAVLATGEIVEFGGESLEMIGPDWTSLFAGSEGLFGVALEITLRLLPKVEAYHTVLASYDSLERAGEAVSRVVASGLLPGALEIMDRLAIKAAEAAVNAGYPKDAEAVLIVELEGTKEELEMEKSHLAELIEASGPAEIHVAADASERARIWKGRKSAFSAVGRLSPDFIVQDGVVPRNRLGEALLMIKKVGVKNGVRIANVFHAGDGNLHPLIMYDGREKGALERAEAAAGEILKTCAEMGGSITGEHGVGMEKKKYMPAMFSCDDIDLMKRVRNAFDPDEIANPGKMFPDGENAGLSLHGLHPLEKEGVISRE
ncbi:MAG: FAD-binding oxidoreductase [Planctomycetes bacterium]|nr:FAD-binding oxidoreductase [Planctomycetota bacterium]